MNKINIKIRRTFIWRCLYLENQNLAIEMYYKRKSRIIRLETYFTLQIIRLFTFWIPFVCFIKIEPVFMPNWVCFCQRGPWSIVEAANMRQYHINKKPFSFNYSTKRWVVCAFEYKCLGKWTDVCVHLTRLLIWTSSLETQGYYN